MKALLKVDLEIVTSGALSYGHEANDELPMDLWYHNKNLIMLSDEPGVLWVSPDGKSRITTEGIAQVLGKDGWFDEWACDASTIYEQFIKGLAP